MLAVYVVLYNGTTLWHTIGLIEIVMTCYGGKSKFADEPLHITTYSLSNSPAVSAHSKHIDVRHHFIRDHVQAGSFSTIWIPTDDMPADIFTKSLPSTTFLDIMMFWDFLFLHFNYFFFLCFVLMGARVCWP